MSHSHDHSHEIKALLTLSKEEIIANWQGLFDDIEDYTNKEVKSFLEHLIDLDIDFKGVVYRFTSPKHVTTFIQTLYSKKYSKYEIISFILKEDLNESTHPARGAVTLYVTSIVAMYKRSKNPDLIFPEAKIKSRS